MAEARYNGDQLDEVVSGALTSFHLEQLDTGVWWMALEHPDGTVDHVTLSTARGAAITGKFENDV